jgi:GntR family transcriptional regulator
MDTSITAEDMVRLIKVDHRADRPVYMQLVDSIKELVYNKTLADGRKLLTVRALAAALDINPNTVARAYQELERDGLLYSRVGRGTFITEPAAAADAKPSAADKMEKLEQEMRSRCLQLGLSESQFLAYMKQKNGGNK